eukprot:6208419-Pleurochrysis_carterae.AAC.2
MASNLVSHTRGSTACSDCLNSSSVGGSGAWKCRMKKRRSKRQLWPMSGFCDLLRALKMRRKPASLLAASSFF